VNEQPQGSVETPPTTAAGWRLLALLIAVSSVGPLSVNIILPALPGLAVAFSADPAIVQLTVSLYFAALGCAQLVHGSLSDRFGRRPVLLGGFAITVLASFIAAGATHVLLLVTARTTQAFGASTGIVIGRAVIRDLYARDRAASMLGWVTMSVVAVPMFGPLVGGLLAEHFGRRAIFLFVGVASLIILTWAAVALPETRPPVMAHDRGRRWWKETRELLTTPAFAGFVLCAAMMSGPFYTIMGGGAHVVMTLMGRSATELGLWLVLASVGYMGGNFLAGSLSVRYGGNAMLAWGLLIEWLGTLSSALYMSLVPDAGPAAIFVPLFVIYIGNGMALPNAIAGAVSVRPNAAGTAAGVTGCLQMGWGAVISQLIAYPMVGATSAAPFAWIMFAQGTVGLAAFWLLVRPKS
jgi:DHA1 family bicyclomycin/chloramphenicol resistance-like MFS transporter